MDRIILLHICCAPCATEVIENLRRKGYKIMGFFYNPNIYPKEEYALRLDNLHKLASCVDLPFFEGAYNTRDWYREIQGSRFKGSFFSPQRHKVSKDTKITDYRLQIIKKINHKDTKAQRTQRLQISDCKRFKGSRVKGLKVQGLESEPEGGERCKICYRMRLDCTARTAKNKGYKAFATTLTVSPYKPSKIINPIGEEVGKRYKIKFLAEDFKKQDGFKRSTILSRKYGLYRQSYCGCEFSLGNEGSRVYEPQRTQRKNLNHEFHE